MLGPASIALTEEAPALRWLTPDWPAPPGVRALSTLRGGGISGPPYATLNLGSHVGDAGTAVLENRRLLRAAANLPAEPTWMTQVHGVSVRELGPALEQGLALEQEMRPELGSALEDRDARAAAALEIDAPADAAVTGQIGRVCAVLTADCLPVLLATESGARVGAAHAGWRGLAAGVIEATVRALGGPPGAVLAWLGPAIGPRNFEVGPEVRDAFLRIDPEAETAFEINSRGRYRADLYTLARRRLTRIGVTRIYGGGECTYADGDRYFSHRRDGQTGRQATLIWRQACGEGG